MRRVASMILLVFALVWSCAAVAGPRGPIEGEPINAYGTIDVILYRTSWCPYCNKARAFLKELGVSLTEYDIEKGRQTGEKMMVKSGSRGVPVVDIEGFIIRGHSPDSMKDANGRKRGE